MKKLLLSILLVTAFAVSVSAERAPVTVGEGEYGCCCPWAEHAGLCPVDIVAFVGMLDEVCFVLDEAGEPIGYCVDDPDGAYLFRGLSWPEVADFIGNYYGFEPTVGTTIDWFCGFGRTSAPGAE